MSDNVVKAKFSNYIEKVIKNTSINYFKKKKHILNTELDIIEIEDVPLSENDNGAIFLLEKDVSHSNLEELFTNKEYYLAMKDLTDRQKLVLYLFIIQSLSVKEIAKIVNISENSVKVTKNQAIKKFLENLKKGNK